MSGLFPMDQYAAFVWGAYGMSAFGIAVIIVSCWVGHARAKARLAALEKTAP